MLFQLLPEEPHFFDLMLRAWLLFAAGAFVVLHFISAPYGRHTRKGWGPTIHRTAGWILMEFPAVVVFLLILLLSPRKDLAISWVFAAIWLVHYVNRTFVFPLRMRGGQLRMPLAIVAMGFFFNLVNGYVQSRYLYAIGPARDLTWLADPRFVVGVAIFAGGFALNLHSDSVLRNLREQHDNGYKIPHGGGYRFVSCPNYLGELLEWTGWAVLTWSVAGVAFLVWTAANLLPRALAHHRWYRETFPDYPGRRKAIIPFVY